ncbi:hypothetical protein B0H11DRAFT_1941441 [Mycena galericulata]|nr:hypothetical protein B0H11DRAFT_1941441 [Mycena galericulata]
MNKSRICVFMNHIVCISSPIKRQNDEEAENGLNDQPSQMRSLAAEYCHSSKDALDSYLWVSMITNPRNSQFSQSGWSARGGPPNSAQSAAGAAEDGSHGFTFHIRKMRPSCSPKLLATELPTLSAKDCRKIPKVVAEIAEKRKVIFLAQKLGAGLRAGIAYNPSVAGLLALLPQAPHARDVHSRLWFLLRIGVVFPVDDYELERLENPCVFPKYCEMILMKKERPVSILDVGVGPGDRDRGAKCKPAIVLWKAQ